MKALSKIICLILVLISNQAQARFTQADEWQGKPNKPITLNKYLYADVDPVNNIDPTGHFSMGSAMGGVNFASSLNSVAHTSVDVFKFASGNGKMSARELGSAVLLRMLPGPSGIKMMKLSNKKKKVHGNSRASRRTQHVYKIDDVQYFDIHKYGISGGVLNKNGTSRRANTQANKLNAPLTHKRYVPMVLFKNIPDRLTALTYRKIFSLYILQAK